LNLSNYDYYDNLFESNFMTTSLIAWIRNGCISMKLRYLHLKMWKNCLKRFGRVQRDQKVHE